MFRPLLFETLRLPTPDTYRTPAGVPPRDLAAYHLEKLERVLAEHHGRIAAMVIEPLVQAAAGMVMHPPGYLRGVRELTRKYDVLLIADEVAVGFGRTGRMFACEHEQVTPDLLCLAKGLTGGYLPMAATLATEEIWQAFLGDICREPDLLSRPHLRRQSAGGGRGAGHARRLRGGADAGSPAGEDRPAGRASAADRRAAARWRRPPVRPDRRHRVGPRPRRRKEPYPWEERRGMRVCDSRPPRRRVAASPGQRAGHHAAAGDLVGRNGPNRRRRRAWHRGGHRLSGPAERDGKSLYLLTKPTGCDRWERTPPTAPPAASGPTGRDPLRGCRWAWRATRPQQRPGVHAIIAGVADMTRNLGGPLLMTRHLPSLLIAPCLGCLISLACAAPPDETASPGAAPAAKKGNSTSYASLVKDRSGRPVLMINYRWKLYPATSVEVRLAAPDEAPAKVVPLYFVREYFQGDVSRKVFHCLDEAEQRKTVSRS